MDTREPSEAERLRKELQQQEQELVASGQPRAVTDAAMGHIHATRTALAAEPADVATAAAQLLALKCLMRRVKASACAQETLGPLIWWYEFGWLVALVSFGLHWHFNLQFLLQGQIWHELAYCMVAGGVGAVIQAIFGLHRHLAAKDFEPSALYWYYAKPLMGVVLGPVAFLFLKIGLLAIGGKGEDGAVQNLEFAVVVAFLAGYSERFWAELIDRMLETLLRPGTRSEPQAVPAGPTAPSPTVSIQPGETRDADDRESDGDDGGDVDEEEPDADELETESDEPDAEDNGAEEGDEEELDGG